MIVYKLLLYEPADEEAAEHSGSCIAVGYHLVGLDQKISCRVVVHRVGLDLDIDHGDYDEGQPDEEEKFPVLKGLLFAVGGARIGFILFYQPVYYHGVNDENDDAFDSCGHYVLKSVSTEPVSGEGCEHNHKCHEGYEGFVLAPVNAGSAVYGGGA